jgi:putative acyl-CoA dehydrogenase
VPITGATHEVTDQAPPLVGHDPIAGDTASGPPGVVPEAMEVLGGNGYVEESGLPRLYRRSPLNSIREGSGNVIALDVLRVMGRSPDSPAAVSAEIELARGVDGRFDDAVERLHAELGDPDELPARARRIAGLLALCLQGSLLLRYAPTAVADTFCASRLGEHGGTVQGMLAPSAGLGKIVERARITPA